MKKTRGLVIVGAGEFAELAYEYFSKDSPYRVAAFCAEKAFIRRNRLKGLPVVDFEKIGRSHPPRRFRAFVAVTYTQLNGARKRLFRETEKKGYELVSFVSSKSFVDPTVTLGGGTFIYDLASIQPFARIGKGVVVGSLCQIAHRAEIGDFAYLASSATVGGFSRVGERAFLGLNSTVIDRIVMTKEAALAAGAVLTRDARKGHVYRGNPADDSGVEASVLFK